MVKQDKRFKRSRPCPICAGHADYEQHQSKRCYGFLSNDGRWAHCTRDEHAGSLELKINSGTYAHLLDGECKCGITHGEVIEVEEIHTKEEKAWKRVEGPRDKLVATYEYTGTKGENLYKCRFERWEDGVCIKRFSWRNGSLYGLHGAQPRLYQPYSVAGTESLFLVEGEKCVDALNREGYYATCSPHGAPDPRITAKGKLGNKWNDEFTEELLCKRIVLLPDNDDAGRQFFALIADELVKVCPFVKVVYLPVQNEHGDVADYIQSQRFLEEPLNFKAMIDATPDWRDR